MARPPLVPNSHFDLYEAENAGWRDGSKLRPRAPQKPAYQRDYELAYDQACARPILILLSGEDYSRVMTQKREGWTAWHADAYLTANPYERDSAEWAAWLAGWMDAKQENS